MNEKEIMNKVMEATFNYESKLLHITLIRYSLKSLEKANSEAGKRISRGCRGSKGSNGKSKNKKKIKKIIIILIIIKKVLLNLKMDLKK